MEHPGDVSLLLLTNTALLCSSSNFNEIAHGFQPLILHLTITPVVEIKSSVNGISLMIKLFTEVLILWKLQVYSY